MNIKLVPTICPHCGYRSNPAEKCGKVVGVKPWMKHPAYAGKLCRTGNFVQEIQCKALSSPDKTVSFIASDLILLPGTASGCTI